MADASCVAKCYAEHTMDIWDPSPLVNFFKEFKRTHLKYYYGKQPSKKNNLFCSILYFLIMTRKRGPLLDSEDIVVPCSPY